MMPFGAGELIGSGIYGDLTKKTRQPEFVGDVHLVLQIGGGHHHRVHL
jgi:hypothetical protein